MQYINGKDVLPTDVLEVLQQYVSGCVVYIPTSQDKVAWGEKSGTKQALAQRNAAICQHHQAGATIRQLSQRFFLSESSIRKIVKRAG